MKNKTAGRMLAPGKQKSQMSCACIFHPVSGICGLKLILQPVFLTIRNECLGTCGKVLQAVGVAIPPTIREVA
jgi:hypothetical protein